MNGFGGNRFDGTVLVVEYAVRAGRVVSAKICVSQL